VLYNEHLRQQNNLLRNAFLATAIGLLVIIASVPAASATTGDPDEGYYPSESYQSDVELVLQNSARPEFEYLREFEYLLDAMIPSTHMANYSEYTILALRDHYTQKFDGFIDSNFINPAPPSPPAPPATTPPPPVVWPSEAFQRTVERLLQNPTEREFNYLLDQVLGSTRAFDYVEYIVLNLQSSYPQRVNDFIQYLIQNVVRPV